MRNAPLAFSTDPGKILDFSGRRPAEIFNEAILPTVNSFADLLPQDPGGLEEARRRRSLRQQNDFRAEQEFRVRNQGSLDAYVSAQPVTMENPDFSDLAIPTTGSDYNAPIPKSAPQVQPKQSPPQTKQGGVANIPADLTGFVKQFEGFNKNAYPDHKQTSIGYGTRAKKGETSITEEEASARLGEELAAARQHVEEMNKKHNYGFAPNELDALTSFAYNVGNIRQLTDNGKRDRNEIAKKMLEYSKASGKTEKGLLKRRKAEQELFIKGY